MATETITIVVNERGARTVRRNIDRIGTSAQKTQGAVQLLRRSLSSFGIVLGGGLALRAVVGTLASFSQEMSTIKAVTGATGAEFTKLRSLAKQLGATTAFTATQVAEGMTFLARTGFTTNEVLTTITDTLNLARAGALDLGRAADLASNVLKGFNLNAEEMTRVVDVMTNSANSANTNIEQMGQAMSFAAPAAAALAIDVETTAAAIGTLGDAGIQATRAGTSLRQIFVKLLKPTPQARKVIKDLSLTTADLDVKSRGLIPVLESLRDANLSLTEAATLVGVRQSANLLILIKSIPKLKELSQANRDAAGTTAEVARIMDDNLNGALLRVKSAFEAVILSFGDAGATGVIRGFFEGLAGALRALARNMDAFVQAVGFLAVAFAALKLPAIIALFSRLSFALLANPVLALTAAVSVLIFSFESLDKNFAFVNGRAVTLGDGLKSAASVMNKQLTDAINSLGGNFSNLREFFDTFIDNLARGFLVLLATVNGVVAAIIAGFRNIPAALEEIALAVDNAAIGFVEGTLNTIEQFGGNILGALGFESLATPSGVELGRLKAAGESAGDIMGTAYKEAFNATLFGTLAASSQRQEVAKFQALAIQAALKAEEGLVDTQLPGIKPPVPDKGTKADKAFGKLLTELKLESELLRLSNKEREIRVALIDAEEDLERKLTTSEKAQFTAIIKSNQAFEEQKKLLDEIRGPSDRYADQIRVLNDLMKEGKITTDEFNDKQRELRITMLDSQKSIGAGVERTFLKMQEDAEDAATQISSLLTGAFKDAEDAFVDFVQGGKLSFKDLIDNMHEQLIRLAFRNATANLGASLGFGQATSGGGLLNSVFGGGSGGGGEGGISGLGKLFSFLPGLANGGSFTVGPNTSLATLPGIDNRLVAIRARDGEDVSVGRGGGMSITNNFILPPNTDVDSIRKSSGRIGADVSESIARAGARNN